MSFRAVCARVRGWFMKTSLERRLEEELRIHFEMLVGEEEHRGKSHDEAKRLARLRLGGLEQTLERRSESFAARHASWPATLDCSTVLLEIDKREMRVRESRVHEAGGET